MLYVQYVHYNYEHLYLYVCNRVPNIILYIFYSHIPRNPLSKNIIPMKYTKHLYFINQSLIFISFVLKVTFFPSLQPFERYSTLIFQIIFSYNFAYSNYDVVFRESIHTLPCGGSYINYYKQTQTGKSLEHLLYPLIKLR